MISRPCFAVVFLFPALSVAANRPDSKAANAVVELPTYGFSIVPPASMQRVIETSPQEAAVWFAIDSTTGAIRKTVRIELLRAEGRELEKVAASTAKSEGGKLVKAPLKMDALPALRIEFGRPQPVNGGDLATTCIVLTQRDRLIYRITEQAAAAQASGDEGMHDLVALVRGWKWTAIVAPAQKLELRTEPINVFDNAFSMRVPGIMRPCPVDDAKIELILGVEDHRREGPDFQISFSRIPKQPGVPFAGFWATTARTLRKQNATEEVIFHQRPGRPPRAACGTVRLTKSDARASAVYGRWILIDPGGDDGVLVTCSMFAPDAADRQRYEKAIDSMIDTISVPTAAQSGPQASRSRAASTP